MFVSGVLELPNRGKGAGFLRSTPRKVFKRFVKINKKSRNLFKRFAKINKTFRNFLKRFAQIQKDY